MFPAPSTRREFLAASAQLLGGGWAALNLPLLASLAGCARDAAVNGEPFTTLTDAEAATLRAVAARILPSGDGLPGAEEAGAVWFMDRVLGEHLPALLPPVQAGVQELEGRAGAGGFASLEPERQDALLKEIEGAPFFGIARTLTLAGVFADPRYGGGREEAGSKLVGIEPHSGAHQAPFGWYDAEYARTGAATTAPAAAAPGTATTLAAAATSAPAAAAPGGAA
jgi:gluconate 2-dehydrogenase gamma chain